MNFPEIIPEPPKKSFGDSLYEADLELSRNGPLWSDGQWLKKIDRESISAEVSVNIANSQMFLGHSSLDYRQDNAVFMTLPYTKQEGGNIRSEPKLIIFCGDRRSGKTVLAKMVALEHGVEHYKIPTLTIDSSKVPEHYMSRYAFTARDIPPPQGPLANETIARVNAYFRWFNMKPHGFSNVVYQPYAGSKIALEGIDKPYRLSYSDFKSLADFDPAEGQQSLLDMLDISEYKTARAIARQILDNDGIASFEGILDAIRTGTLKQDTDAFNREGERAISPVSFRRYLNAAIDANLITDEPQLGVDMIADALTHDFVCLRHRLRSAAKDNPLLTSVNMYPKVAINEWLNERLRGVSGTAEERERCRFKAKAGLQFFLEEADSIMPANGDSYTATLGEHLGSKEGKTGAFVIAVVQNIKNLMPDFVEQADYVFTPQLNIKGNEQFFREQGVRDRMIDALKRMPQGVKNSLGFKVSFFRAFDMHKNLFGPAFAPRVPLAAFKIT